MNFNIIIVFVTCAFYLAQKISCEEDITLLKNLLAKIVASTNSSSNTTIVPTTGFASTTTTASSTSSTTSSTSTTTVPPTTVATTLTSSTLSTTIVTSPATTSAVLETSTGFGTSIATTTFNPPTFSASPNVSTTHSIFSFAGFDSTTFDNVFKIFVGSVFAFIFVTFAIIMYKLRRLSHNHQEPSNVEPIEMIQIEAAANSSANEEVVEESSVEILPLESTASALPSDATTILTVPEKVDKATNTEYTVYHRRPYFSSMIPPLFNIPHTEPATDSSSVAVDPSLLSAKLNLSTPV